MVSVGGGAGAPPARSSLKRGDQGRASIRGPAAFASFLLLRHLWRAGRPAMTVSLSRGASPRSRGQRIAVIEFVSSDFCPTETELRGDEDTPPRPSNGPSQRPRHQFVHIRY